MFDKFDYARIADHLDNIINRYVSFCYGGPRDNRNAEPGMYPFVPTGKSSALLGKLLLIKDMLQESQEKGSAPYTRPGYRMPRFLDCGCGIGNLLVVASVAGFTSYGIEYDYQNVQRARKLTQNENVGERIIHGDIRYFDGYNFFDVIYFFQPMYERESMKEFTKKLAEDMRVGAFVIPNGEDTIFHERNFEKIKFAGCGNVVHCVFRKVKE
jgi:SAM-dependent methyltransferase